MTTITFQNDAVIEEDDLNLSLLEIALKHGIPHMHVCGGQGKCSTCRIIIQKGADNFLPKNQVEQNLSKIKGLDEHIRLACQTRIKGPVALRRLVLDDQDLSFATLQHQMMPGRELKLAILFSDIRGFTLFSERHLPYDVIHVLNRYFNEMGKVIFRHQGFIDRYNGDSIMALFGINDRNPNKNCMNAISSAIEMKQSLTKFNRYLQQNFNETVEIGIGIHFGEVVLGEIGHQSKTQLTAIGDAVNIASRIEEKTKSANSSILISESMYKQINDRVCIGKTLKTTLKGKSGFFQLYELHSLKAGREFR